MTKKEIIQVLLQKRINILLTSWTTKSDWEMYYGLNLLKSFEYNGNITQLQNIFILEQGICYSFIFVNDIEVNYEDLGEMTIEGVGTSFHIFLLKSPTHSNISISLYSVNEFQTDNVIEIVRALNSYCYLQQTAVLTERIYENVHEKVKRWKKDIEMPLCVLIRDTVSRADDLEMEGDSTNCFLEKWKSNDIQAFSYKEFNYNLIFESIKSIDCNLNGLFEEIRYCSRSFKDLFPILVPFESIEKSMKSYKFNTDEILDMIISEIEKGISEEGLDYKKMVDISVPEWRAWLSSKLKDSIEKKDYDSIKKIIYVELLNMVELETKQMLNENFN